MASRIRNRAADSVVGGSLSRWNRGAASTNTTMMQARTTEGLAPVRNV